MSRYKRFLFTKSIYPEYIVFIVCKDNLYTYDNDLEIVKFLGKENILNGTYRINYLILDRLDIKFIEYDDNNYFYYFKITLIKSIIDYVNDRRKICLKK
ncbi:MAG: hypothetical protein IJ501_04000 [Bacilli bacterium]|nr:hypothetical protein [Bacilli bacterium]